MVNTSVCYGVNTKLNPNTYTKLDYRFVGWTAYRKSDNKWYYTDGKGNSKWCLENKQPNGYSKAVYKDCSKVAKTSSVNGDVVTMYAQWENSSWVMLTWMEKLPLWMLLWYRNILHT